ncbi:hypothetical protein [Hoylesella loescheii]|nr:hypothetical protein [Hoylesella loescheii]
MKMRTVEWLIGEFGKRNHAPSEQDWTGKEMAISPTSATRQKA